MFASLLLLRLVVVVFVLLGISKSWLMVTGVSASTSLVKHRASSPSSSDDGALGSGDRIRNRRKRTIVDNIHSRWFCGVPIQYNTNGLDDDDVNSGRMR